MRSGDTYILHKKRKSYLRSSVVPTRLEEFINLVNSDRDTFDILEEVRELLLM